MLGIVSGDVGNTHKTVPLRPISWIARVQQIIKRIRYAAERRVRRAAIQARIKQIEAQHLQRLQAEGYVVVRTRNGWHCTFTKWDGTR